MRILLALVGWAVLLGSAGLTLDRYLTVPSKLVAVLASVASYALLGYLAALVLLLPLALRRGEGRPWCVAGTVLALVGVGLATWLVSPLYVGARAGKHTDLTVMTANLWYGQGDPDTVVRTVVDRHVDLLVLEEVPEWEEQRLEQSGLTKALPNTLRSGDGNAVMVFSRYPLTQGAAFDVSQGGIAATVQAPSPFQLLAVHTSSPARSVTAWAQDLRTVRDRARSTTGPLLVMGDFNATLDHAQFRRVLGARLRDSVVEARSGWQPTWPSRYRTHLGPVLTLDHVLTSSRFAAVRTRTVDIPHSDHKGLLVDLDRS